MSWWLSPKSTVTQGENHCEDRLSDLFQQHNNKLVRYLAAKLNSEEEALEVAQEAYVRLLKLDDDSNISYLKAFLYRTADNLAIDRLRRRVRTSAIFDASQSDAELALEQENPERHAQADSTLRLVREAIDELPAKCRKAFVLYKFYEQDYKQIAEEMELTESMIRKYVLKALRHIQERIKV